jgi:inorganic pyrophosphatase
MKIELNLKQLQTTETNDKTICLRIPQEDFEDLKAINGNVSQVVRGLIEQFLEQYKEANRKWTRNK